MMLGHRPAGRLPTLAVLVECPELLRRRRNVLANVERLPLQPLALEQVGWLAAKCECAVDQIAQARIVVLPLFELLVGRAGYPDRGCHVVLGKTAPFAPHLQLAHGAKATQKSTEMQAWKPKLGFLGGKG